MDYRFRIFKGADGLFYLSIIHKNGNVLLVSEGYNQKRSAKDMWENFCLDFLDHWRLSDKSFIEIMSEHTDDETDGDD